MDADEYKRLIASGTSNPKFAKQRLKLRQKVKKSRYSGFFALLGEKNNEYVG